MFGQDDRWLGWQIFQSLDLPTNTQHMPCTPNSKAWPASGQAVTPVQGQGSPQQTGKGVGYDSDNQKGLIDKRTQGQHIRTLVLTRGQPRQTNRQLLGCPQVRSEEHTSELQSRGHLVCRLLLEK